MCKFFFLRISQLFFFYSEENEANFSLCFFFESLSAKCGGFLSRNFGNHWVFNGLDEGRLFLVYVREFRCTHIWLDFIRTSVYMCVLIYKWGVWYICIFLCTFWLIIFLFILCSFFLSFPSSHLFRCRKPCGSQWTDYLSSEDLLAFVLVIW